MKVSLSEVADLLRGDNRGSSGFTERLLLKIIEDKDSKKDDDKKERKKPIIGSPGDAGKLAILMLVTMPLTGPLYLVCMALMWKMVKVSLAQ